MPPAARITDNHTCPKVDPPPHVGGPIIQGETTVLIGFQRTHPPGQKEWSGPPLHLSVPRGKNYPPCC